MAIANTPMNWRDDGFDLGPFHFVQDWGETSLTRPAVYPTFVLMKSRPNVETYARILSEYPGNFANVLELGIMRGGSCAFFNALLRPQYHLAIDICERESGLRHLAELVSSDRRLFVSRYDLDQTDTGTIAQVFSEMSPADPMIDLILDDASHDFEMTLKSFNGLFPLLRAGAIYVLEDWGWGHWGPFQDANSSWFANPAMSNIVLYAALHCTTHAGSIISRVEVTPDATFVYRGAGPLEPGFALESGLLLRGRKVSLL
jgi:cephalosporin hydroxylase